MNKKEFVTKYMKKIDGLRFLEVSEDLISFFSNIYDIYQKMVKDNKVNEEQLKKLFIEKSNLLTSTTEELLKDRTSSKEDIADAFRTLYSTYSWPNNGESPINTIEKIYQDLNKHLNNKKVLLAFPGFDIFCELKEKHFLSPEIMSHLLKGMTTLDFRELNGRVTYYFEELPKERQVQRDTLQTKMNALEREYNSYINCLRLMSYEKEYQRILPIIEELGKKSDILETQKQDKLTEKYLKEKALKNEKRKSTTLNRGLNKLFGKTKLNNTLEAINSLTKDIKELEEEIRQLEIKLTQCIKEKEVIENDFYIETFVKVAKFSSALAIVKDEMKNFENYDKDIACKEIENLKTQIAEIDKFLEAISKKDTNGKKIS